MKNERPDGQNVRDLLEAALEQSLGARAQQNAAPVAGSPVVVGEVVDTHHPHLPGRILVHWWESAERERSEWLHHERHLALVRGDRVLVTLPLGWAEWLVTGALRRAAVGVTAGATAEAPVSAAPEQPPAPAVEAAPATPSVRLEPGQSLVVMGHDGAPLLELRQGAEGVVVELARDEIEIKARRRLRLSADSIEIAAGPGGVDVRTDGEAVTRARAIRLN